MFPLVISVLACVCVRVREAGFATVLLIECETRRTNHKLTSVVTRVVDT